MSYQDCTCEFSENLKALQRLFSKLERAKFTGELHLTFEGGNVSGAELCHLLPYSELGRELPTIEETGEFCLKP